jgi:Zn-dependent protease
MEATHYRISPLPRQEELGDGLTGHFLAWRVLRAGNREIIEALVAPEHHGPSASLAASLGKWRGAFYWVAPNRDELVLVRPLGPTTRERWLLHIGLFVLTLICSLGAGAALSGAFQPPEGEGVLGWFGAALLFFGDFFRRAGGGSPAQWLVGWPFALPLLTILLVHEFGHYFAARRYAVDASPPYFLPMPPTLSPIGSLGAFLRLRSPVLDRRQLMDIGAAGPLAGFVVTLGVLWWGFSVSHGVAEGEGPAGTFVRFGHASYLLLGDSVLTRLLREHYFPGTAALQLSLPGFAGWAGAFITGLNLLPLSQLDGGHVTYGLFGRRQSTVALATILGLAYLSWQSPAWLVWIFLTLLVGGGRWAHPPVLSPERPVPRSRWVVGWLCILIFALTFVPRPFGG